MTNELTDNSYAGHPSTAPMPDHPISDASGPSGPVPELMPGSDASSASGSQEQAADDSFVIALADYPGGRGGMGMVAPGSAEQSAEPEARKEAQIGPRPVAADMPPPS